MSEACFLAEHAADPRCEYRADGLPDRAHLIPAQRLRHAGLGEQVWDRRVYVMACRRHHHLLDQGFIKLDLVHYPQALRSFADEHGFYWAGERAGWRKEAPQAAA